MFFVFLLWLVALGRTILNLLTVPRLGSGRMPRRTPLVSVIIPARDEERMIGRTVAAMLAQTYPALEVIVVNDRSTDRTGEILAAFDDPRLLVLEGEEPPPGWLGKPHALHLGSRRASGELLLFVDADVIYAPDAVAGAVAHLEESGLPMITLLPNLEMHGFWEHAVMPNLLVFAFTFAPLWLTNRTRSPILAVGGGPGNLVRRADYEAAGGHEALKDAVVDDIALARLIRRHGLPTGVIRAERHVSVRMYRGLGEIVEGFTKNAFAVFGRKYVLGIGVVVVGVAVHLLPYALALAGNVWAIATVGLITLIRVILFRAIGYRLDNAILGHPLMLGVWLWITIRSMWLTGVRRELRWRGRTYDAEKTKFGAD